MFKQKHGQTVVVNPHHIYDNYRYHHLSLFVYIYIILYRYLYIYIHITMVGATYISSQKLCRGVPCTDLSQAGFGGGGTTLRSDEKMVRNPMKRRGVKML